MLRLSRDPEASLDDMAQVLSRDPALCTKMLRTANSARFSLGHEVTTLQQATMVLGMKSVRLMALSFSLASSLPKSGSGSFDYDGYWRRSLVSAVAAQSLALQVGSLPRGRSVSMWFAVAPRAAGARRGGAGALCAGLGSSEGS